MTGHADSTTPGQGTAIEVSGLGKAYKRYGGKWARLGEWLTGRDRHEKHWVLRDIGFRVGRGEAVGIIGVNGAGKSTLLKIITGTTQPTCGSVRINGRVAALLELGMGFHPDFTGRQNVFTAGQLQGMAIGDIEAAFADIEAFADIGDYIDQPVRTYSSGMQVRLAFAVATAVRPDVLIVDEALAVGDAAFQRKCHRRIESFSELGTTLLFVSHDIEGIKKLCQRAMFIHRGELVALGPAKPVCDQYETMLFGRAGAVVGPATARGPGDAGMTDGELVDPSLLGTEEATYGNGQATIEQVWLEDDKGRRINILTAGEHFSVCYTVRLGEAAEAPVMAMLIKTLEGIALYGTDSRSLGQSLPTPPAGGRLAVRFRIKCQFAAGVYFLNCGVRDGRDAMVFYHRRVDVLAFKVRKADDVGQIGLLALDAEFAAECL